MTLPNLDDHHPLTDDAIERYRRNGHVLLEGVLDRSEIDAYRPVLEQAAFEQNTEERSLEERDDTYDRAFLQIMNLWEDREEVASFVLANRFGGIAARLMGVDAVRVYHDQALFKEASGGHTPWHQDQHHWPIDADRTVTMWMPLVDVTEQMGTMTFATGSHREGDLGDHPISDESEARFADYIERQGYEVARSGDMNAGDATFHSGWILHRAPANRTDAMRKAITIIYYPDGTRVTEPTNEDQKGDFERWFPDREPGDRADGPLHPKIASPSP